MEIPFKLITKLLLQSKFANDSIIDNNQSINIKYTHLPQGTLHGEPFQMNETKSSESNYNFFLFYTKGLSIEIVLVKE